MFADGEVTNPSSQEGDQIRVPDVYLDGFNHQSSSQDLLHWQTSTSIPRNDSSESGGRWVWQTDGASLCPDIQEQYMFTWGDEQGDDHPDSQADFIVDQVVCEGNLESTNIQLQELYTSSIHSTTNSPVPSTNFPQPVVSSTSSSLHATSSEPSVHLPQAAEAGNAFNFSHTRMQTVKCVKDEGRRTKLWKCTVCGRDFQHHYTLMRHLPTHTDERNYHCQECSKSFRQLSTLNQHRAIHSAARPFSCEICKKTFNRVSTLISHRKTHSGKKPYNCSVCPKGFYQKGNLRNHEYTHTNERPYRCALCDKGFNQQSNLVCHKLKAHSNEGNLRPMISPVASLAPPRPSTTICSTSSHRSQQAPRSSKSQYEVTSTIDLDEKSLETLDRTSQDVFNAGSFDSLSDWLYDDYSSVSMDQDQNTMAMIVDPIKTYHMELALATRQTPFALLRPKFGNPILVKVVETEILGGKQLLVPATTEELRASGKIVIKEENKEQIRVPVVATVVPTVHSSGQLFLNIEEPHASAAPLRSTSEIAMLADTTMKTEPGCSSKTAEECGSCNRVKDGFKSSKDPVFGHLQGPSKVHVTSCTPPPPPAVSPCRGLDLFDPTDCMPMGPQITAVEASETAADRQDIFTQLDQFQDSRLIKLGIHLSDSE